MNSINRELKKQQLRKQIVQNPAQMHPISGDYHDPEEEEAKPSQPRLSFRRSATVGGVILLIAAVLTGGVIYWRTYHQYAEYSVSWEAELKAGEDGARTEGSFTGYVNFGENIIKYTKDGASYIDARGKTVWIQAYEMKSPVVAVNGDYIAIADQQGNSIYICDKNGCQGVATTLLPILKVSVSAKGLAAAILEDAKSNYITMFQKNGEPLDITIKVRLSGNGYPLDFSLSPDGTQMICSYMYLRQGMLDCRVVFYNFSEIGKNESPFRLVGGFDEDFTGSMVPRVQFLNDEYSFACSDKGLSFFSSKNLASPELLAQAAVESEIQSLFYSDSYVGVVVQNGAGEAPYRMEVYRPDGRLVMEKEFNFPYQYVSIDGDQILMWNDSSLQVYNLSGVEKFHGTFDFVISRVMAGRFANSYRIVSPQKITEITLQK